tara:strand:+ start:617 stop:1078 length:462 start_codon:yes stop_codon:yes gene_type:complete
MSTGEAQDLILEYCIKNKPEMVSASQLHEELLSETPTGIINHLLEKISLASDEIAIVKFGESNNFIAATDLTEVFINQGGFTKQEKDEAEQKRIQNERDNIAFEKSKIDLDLAKKMLKEYPKTKWMSRLGFFIGTVLAILKLVEYLGLLKFPN